VWEFMLLQLTSDFIKLESIKVVQRIFCFFGAKNFFYVEVTFVEKKYIINFANIPSMLNIIISFKVQSYMQLYL
jgi:hypothetical protein